MKKKNSQRESAISFFVPSIIYFIFYLIITDFSVAKFPIMLVFFFYVIKYVIAFYKIILSFLAYVLLMFYLPAWVTIQVWNNSTIKNFLREEILYLLPHLGDGVQKHTDYLFLIYNNTSVISLFMISLVMTILVYYRFANFIKTVILIILKSMRSSAQFTKEEFQHYIIIYTSIVAVLSYTADLFLFKIEDINVLLNVENSPDLSYLPMVFKAYFSSAFSFLILVVIDWRKIVHVTIMNTNSR